MGRGSSWGSGRHHSGRRCLCQRRIGLPSGQRTRELTTTNSTSSFRLLFLTTISRSYWHSGRSKRAWHPGRSKMGGRWEHVNIDTTTCDPIVSTSKEKIGLKMRVFPQNLKPIGGIGPLAQKGLIQREFPPLTVAKVQKGGFHGCQRLSKSRLWAMTTIHWKFMQKREGLSHRWGSLQVFLTQDIWNSLKTAAFEGRPIFNRWERSSQPSTAVKSYPDCSQNQLMLE